MTVAWRIDRYRCTRPIHEGEHTTLWAAEHEVLGSPQVLKVLKPDAPGVVRRALIEEGRIQASVRHPHVMRVADAFVQEPLVVIVMEHVSGASLADRIEAGTLPLGSALALFRGVVRGVRAIHARGIVHRDLKPENILIEDDGQGVRPLVADFGMAKRVQLGQPGRPRGLSLVYEFMGTPEYMAPEQAEDPSRVDARADLFSLGAILYELVGGELCFEAERSVDAIFRAARGQYVPLRELVPSVSPALDAVVDDLLRPKPADRIQTAAELLQRLDPIRA